MDEKCRTLRQTHPGPVIQRHTGQENVRIPLAGEVSASHPPLPGTGVQLHEVQAGRSRIADDTIFLIATFVGMDEQCFAFGVEEVGVAERPHARAELTEHCKALGCRCPGRKLGESLEQQQECELGVRVTHAVQLRLRSVIPFPEAPEIAVVSKVTDRTSNRSPKGMCVAEIGLAARCPSHVCDHQAGRHALIGDEGFERTAGSGTRFPVEVSIPSLCERDAPAIPVRVPLSAVGRERGELVPQPGRLVAGHGKEFTHERIAPDG